MPKKRTLLFVDDDQAFLHAMARLFHGWDLDILCEESGEAALLTMGNTPVDVIIIDCRMPGMGGIALASETSRNFPGVLSIMISGCFTVKDLLNVINAGNVHRALEKPFHPADVQLAIISALKHKITIESSCRNRSADDYLPLDLEQFPESHFPIHPRH